MPIRRVLMALLLGLLLGAPPLALWLAPSQQPSVVQRLQARGELIVASRRAPTTWYRGPEGPKGLEHDLVQDFAQGLGVEARFVFPDDIGHLLQMTSQGAVHLAAAGLTVTPERRRFLRFGQPYQEVSEQLVYRLGSRRPRFLDEIAPYEIQVVAGSAHEETLRRLQRRHPGLKWIARREVDLYQLLEGVERGEIRYTVADSNDLLMAARIYRHLKAAFDLSEHRPLAWAFPPFGDDSLRQAADAYLARIRRDGTLARLLEHYYGHAGRLNFVDKRDFLRHIRERLPRLRPYFELAERQTGIDWRLLAAIAYQESHWDPKAKSPTGVRGVMMLTRATARQLGVEDRLDPEQSILGGARYLRIVEEKIPARIPEPDRLWLTLAGYNIGFGHLEDARILTQAQGGDPDRWTEVRERLPLLNRKAWEKRLKYGRANGVQAVEYVENIRNYYDLLVWYDNHPEDLALETETEDKADDGGQAGR